MKTFKGIFRLIIILCLVAAGGFSGYRLWTMYGVYAREEQVKNELLAYRPQFTINGNPGPAGRRPAEEAETPDGAADITPPAGRVNLVAYVTQPVERVKQAANATPEDGRTNRAADITPPAGQGGRPTDEPGAPVERERADPGLVKMQNEINGDIAGWITIPNTHIDYPIVIADDNTYYLDKDVYKNKASAGSIFLDCRCSGEASCANTIIYGHNMKNRSMFGDIREFADMDFFEENTEGVLLLGNVTYKLEIFAYLVTGANDAVIYNPSARGDELVKRAAEDALNYREPRAGADIATLSTCAYDYDGARMVLLAAMVPSE